MLPSIRVALIDDIPALRKLIDESVRALSTPYYDRPQIESALTHIFGVDTQLILDGTYFVAEVDGKIVGCGGWSKRQTLYGGDQLKSDEPDQLLKPATDAARIRAFFVHPQWSRKGIGTMIIRCCEEAARSAGFKKMELAATLPGEPLYSASGYSVTGRIEIPTPDGQMLPVLQMEKTLNGQS